MAVSTTLVTFMVRAPPTTRMLTLYGSWDNFRRPYGMQRDLRMGAEHWTGCHNFSNIICDGRPDDLSSSRDGGLKMGGTYWYYYKLDDEIEFHNSAEPSTTACPMLPGQLINVLQVPFVLSGNRQRNPSVSSTSSEIRTLNPSDKFMNPRPVPKPKLVRLNTSPTETQFSDSVSRAPAGGSSWSTASAVEPSSSSRFWGLSRKASNDSFARSSSSSRNKGGIREALRRRPEQSRSPISIRSRSSSRRRDDRSSSPSDGHRTRTPSPVSRPSGRSQSANSRRPRDGLLLRSQSEDRIQLNSFEEHRRQRSSSRDTSSGRSSVLMEDATPIAPKATYGWPRHQPLDTLREVASALPTPAWPPPDEVYSDPKSEVLLEKRLPTLPSTPSSAYPPSLAGDSPGRELCQRLENLQSHFSTTTINTEPRMNSLVTGNQSHFSTTTIDSEPRLNSMLLATGGSPSGWSSPNALLSPASETSIDESIASPALSEYSSYINHPAQVLTFQRANALGRLPGSDAPSLMSSSADTSEPTTDMSPSETPCTVFFDLDHEERATPTYPRSPLHTQALQHYSLPEDEYAAAVTLKHSRSPQSPRGRGSDGGLSPIDSRKHDLVPPTNNVIHSETMQHLLNELSYLSGMIQK